MSKIDSSVVVITGASSGIGRAAALRIAERGGTLVLAARQEKALEDLARECRNAGGEALPVPTDVTDPKQVERCAQRAAETFGRIDAWINNAAVSLFARLEEAPIEDFRRVMETNLFGYIYGARAVLPYFREQGRGILINVSSVVAKTGQPLTTAYTTSKFAIDGFSESLRMELEDAPGIHVCTIHPASIDTPLFQHAANFTGKKIKPMEPVYAANEVANAIIRCIEKPRREITVGRAGKGVNALRTVAPGLTKKAMAEAVPEEHLTEARTRSSHGNLFKPVKSYNRVSGGWREDPEPAPKQKWIVAAAAIAVIGAAGAGTAGWLSARQKNKRRPFRPLNEHHRRPGEVLSGIRERLLARGK